MKKYILIAVIIISLMILSFLFISCGLMDTMSAKELKDAVEIVDLNTKWVSKEYQVWPAKLILVPAVTFKIKNKSEKPLSFVNFNANFRFVGEQENMGDDFRPGIGSQKLMPGETSEEITMASNFGVEGKSLSSFKDNPQWRTAMVTLFAQSKGSQWIELGEWTVSKKIDFKEDEPVGMGEKKEKEKKK